MGFQAVVTGATGFIGSHLLDSLLQADYQVTAAVRASSRRESLLRPKVTIRETVMADVSSWASVIAGADVVFHLAGAVAGTSAELHAANQAVTSALAEACARASIPPVLILMSSLSAAGPASRDRPKGPADVADPISDYGRSKRAGELAALAWADKVPLTILRPGIVFGPRDTELVQVLRPIRRWGLVPTAGSHDPPVSFVHVSDLVHAARLAAQCGARCKREPEHDSGRGIYFVADPQPMTFAEMGCHIGEGLKKRRVRPLRIPLPVARAAAVAAERWQRLLRKRGTFNPDKIREAAAPAWTCDVRSTMDELNWKPAMTLPERFRRASKKGFE